MSKPLALAISAHPDDIEFMMAGTMLLLKQAGYELHMMNIANGSCGTATHTREAIVARRLEEARAAARTLGAHLHDPIADDLEIVYTRPLLKQVCAVVRDVRPTLMLVPSPQDYMEDHICACRIAVSAAFFRGMRNFSTTPPREPISEEVTLYHALPYGLTDGLRRVIKPGQYVNITPVLACKREALACHRSQKEWLDTSQGLDSYLHAMEDMARTVGAWSVVFEYAEGWRRHAHLGFCAEGADPLTEALGDKCIVSEEYERAVKAGRLLEE
ncbi:MAG TPA: PIG-L family deacetylase [Candidatus Hydrogenedentes bacterium]|nr:PIG-L family deacetylase [Candidatus Hydrogenedentota bacterium]HNT87688.1 PIG-L family deacetylase [Candidatus Hydrogenedentota bacterium]